MLFFRRCCCCCFGSCVFCLCLWVALAVRFYSNDSFAVALRCACNALFVLLSVRSRCNRGMKARKILAILLVQFLRQFTRTKPQKLATFFWSIVAVRSLPYCEFRTIQRSFQRRTKSHFTLARLRMAWRVSSPCMCAFHTRARVCVCTL